MHKRHSKSNVPNFLWVVLFTQRLNVMSKLLASSVCMYVCNLELAVLQQWWQFCLQRLRQRWWGASLWPSSLEYTNGEKNKRKHYCCPKSTCKLERGVRNKNLWTPCKKAPPQAQNTSPVAAGHWKWSEWNIRISAGEACAEESLIPAGECLRLDGHTGREQAL